MSRAYRVFRSTRVGGGGAVPRITGPRPVRLLVGGTATAFAMAFGLIAGSLLSIAQSFVAALPPAEDLVAAPMSLTTRVYDRTGEHLLYTIAEEQRELVSLNEVPKMLQDATIAIEDKSFWTNPGIDPSAMIRALNANLSAGGITQGGSTITQQLIKARLLDDSPTFDRKLKEAFLALEAQQLYSKEQILEMYFNQIYYGRQAYGIRVAARTFFGVTDLSALTLGQMALLAGLPQAPTTYDPEQNPEGAGLRRAHVLNAMVAEGYIDDAAAAAADAEPIAVRPLVVPISAPHFTFRVREQLAREFGEAAVARGGYTVLTSLDWNMQELAEAKVRQHVDRLRSSNVQNASLVTMDPTTGEVLAYVGSYDYWKNTPGMRGDYDHAGIAYRQPGSTFKLFTYLTAMLKKGYTASSIVYDIGFEIPDGSGNSYKPQNAPDANGKWQQRGPITMRQALRESLNLPALWTTNIVGVPAILDTVKQMGIDRSWDSSRFGLSFGIGAGEMRLMEMASAYQVVANNGSRVEPTMIMKVLDSQGRVIRDYTKPQGKQVIPAGVAWSMTDILKDNTNPNGSFLFGPWTTIGRPAALKTGTTDNLQDVLAIGYTPTRLTAIWMGNSDNSEMRGISSAMGPGVLWQDYMRGVTGGLPAADFTRPEGIVEKVVCVNPSLYGGNGSGKLPGPFCPAGFRMTERFAQGTEPTTNDSDYYTSCGIRLVSPIPEWQKFMNAWAANANAHAAGRFSWAICGFAQPSPSPSATPGPTPTMITPNPRPTNTPRPPSTPRRGN